MISNNTIRTSVAVVAIAGVGFAGGYIVATSTGDDNPTAAVENVAQPEPATSSESGVENEAAPGSEATGSDTAEADTAAEAPTTSSAGDNDESDPAAAETSDAAAPGTGAHLDGAWSTDGARLVDGSGAEVRIRGVNWFGFETSTGVPHGLWSRNMEEMLDQVADLGFNTIRVPFSAAIIDSDQPVEDINEAENPDLAGLTSLDVLDRFVEASGERGLAVILDRHALAPDNRHNLWYDDEYGPERLVSDWEFLATRYRDVPNIIGADLYNEPYDEACWGCGDPAVDWHAAAQEAGDALHAIEPDWLVFVEGVEETDGEACDPPDAAPGCTWWGGDLSAADEVPIVLAESNKVVYSPHEYATSVYRQRWFDDPDFPANMPDIWDEFWGDLERTDAAPVMVGEFGTTLDSDVDAVWLAELLEYMDEIDAGFTFWSFNPNSGDTGGILEDDWTTVDTEKMSYLEPYLLGPFPPVAAEFVSS